MTSGEAAGGGSQQPETLPGPLACAAPDSAFPPSTAAAPPRRSRLAPPEHALVPGGASGTRATVVVALGFVAMLASSPGQTYWLSLFADDMIAGTGLGRTGFSVVYAGATVFSAAIVLAHLGSTLAAAALPPVAAGLLAAFGWRASLQITAVVVLVAILPVALVVRWAVPASARAGRRPRRSAAPVARLIARARRFPWRGGGGTLLIVLSAAPLISTAVIFHATSLLAGGGMSRATAAAALSLTAVGGGLGAVFGGVLIDRAGVRATLVTMSALLALAMALLAMPLGLAALAAFALLGFAAGMNATSSGAAWARTFGVERLSELQSVGEAARIAAAALGPLPLAIAADLTGVYAIGLAALAAFALACSALSARWPRIVA